MVVFDVPDYFHLLWFVLMFSVGYFFYRAWQLRARQAFSDRKMLRQLCPESSPKKQIAKYILSLLSLVFMVVALVDPKIPGETATVKRKGIDVVFMIDVSKSMDAEDVSPDRISKAKQIVSKVVEGFVSDRVGVIVYAGSAHPLLPITTDYAVVETFLEGVNTDMMSSRGTSIMSAFSLAEEYLNKKYTNNIIVLISDGEDHQGVALDRITEMSSKGLRVVTVGVGTENGGPIPIRSKSRQVSDYKKDQKGEVVITRMDRTNLERIAKEGKGIYVDGTDTRKVVGVLTTLMKNLEKRDMESELHTEYEHLFQPFLWIVWMLLLLEMLLFGRSTLWMRKTNLFNEK